MKPEQLATIVTTFHDGTRTERVQRVDSRANLIKRWRAARADFSGNDDGSITRRYAPDHGSGVASETIRFHGGVS